MKYSFLTQKAEVKKSSIEGVGVFAKKKIRKGEVVAIFGGRILSYKEIDELDRIDKDVRLEDVAESIQIYDSHYLTGIGLPDPLEPSDFLNHSCEPNLGIKGQVVLVAMRDIQPGEELTFDYAMIETRDMRFRCRCQSKNCRGLITKDDWKLQTLQKKYKGYFSWFIEEKIDKLTLKKQTLWKTHFFQEKKLMQRKSKAA